MRPPFPATAREELQRWRTRMLTSLLWTTGIATATLGAFATVQVRSIPFAVVSGVASLSMLGAALGKQAPFRLRAITLLLALYAGASASLALGGLSPNVLVAMCASIVMGMLLLGQRWGIAMVLLAAGTVSLVITLRNAGLLPTDLHVAYENPDARTLLRVIVAFVLLSSAIVASVSYLLARTEDSFLQKAQAFERLEHEQAQRRETGEELRRAEAALHKARELEVLGRLSSSVAHDFNNALLIIQANADLARLRPSYVETALHDIRAAIQQAAATTRQLRAFCPQSQRPPRPLILGDTLEREVELLRRILPANIELRYERPAGELTVLGDEGQLQSALTNLALNARDAMPEGGTLEMLLREAAPNEIREAGAGVEFAVIDVVDTGVGMSRETAARIFEPFFTTKGAAGTGLGLASAHAIVERGGGRIEVSSEVGRGTRFRIFWPLHRAEAPAATEEVAVEPVASGTVLVVDDDDDVRSAMATPLAWRGYTVLEAKSGAEALLVGRRHLEPIRVLCIDLVMPGTPTQKVIDDFRAVHPETRIILCSGYVPEDTGRPLEGIDAFLPKPFSSGTLAGVIYGLVSKGSGTSETRDAGEVAGAES